MGGVDMWHVGGERKSNLSSLDWSKPGDPPEVHAGRSSGEAGNDAAENHGSLFDRACDLNGFSSSLPALLHEKLNFGSSLGQLEDSGPNMDGADDDVMGPLDEELVSRAIGDILPGDEEELLSGITQGLDWMNFTATLEENDDFDLFSSGGGLELDGEPQEKFGVYMNSSGGLDGFYGGGPNVHGPSSNGPSSVTGEHPYGEHPSRTLFVRNINSNVEDSELRTLFEHYGDIRTLYTACKHRGFVMISFYDIRAARNAMRGLQNKPLRRRKLDIHFSIPKDNPSDKDINQGTLVVFNLDASVSNDDLRQIFGRYGEVKEIRETPHKRHHKFIEFYDVRAAEAALRALNRSDIAGKRIKLEPSRPGGARRSLMQQLSQEPEQDDGLYRQQSSPSMTNSPPGHLSSWGNFGSPIENGPPGPLHHTLGTSVPNMTKNLPGLPVPPSNHICVGTIGSHLGRSSHMDAGLSSVPSGLGLQGLPAHHAHSLPEYGNSGMPFYNQATPMLMRGASHGPHDSEGTRLPRSSSSDISLFDHAAGALGMPGIGGSLRRLNSASTTSAALSGPQFLWGNSNPYQHNNVPPVWSNPPPVSHTLTPAGHTSSQPLGYGGNPSCAGNSVLPFQRYHVGSAPSGDPSFLERQFTYVRESPEASFYHPGPASGTNLPRRTGPGMMNLGGVNSGGFFESGSSLSLGVMSPRRRGHMFPPPSSMIMGGGYIDMLGIDRGWIRRSESNASQSDNKKQYQLDIERILRGEDNRTTLMIKNIPNKYTSKMLLAAIDENHRGMYDFLYLPIDFKNKCNVGYAFINMTSPNHIISLYQAFNGKKWEKFNSEKVASLAYARIQGRAALVAHFQNSSLMNEDKRCRPILFNSEGPEASDREPSFLEVADRTGLNRGQIDATDVISKAGSQDGFGSVGLSLGVGSSLAKEE